LKETLSEEIFKPTPAVAEVFSIAVEFLKANQSAFEAGMALNMGQWLSLPLVLAGVYFIWASFQKEKNASQS
jgi:prolipoprotein diacylglyceryltransferase